jgi:putative DNA primase/helicase
VRRLLGQYNCSAPTLAGLGTEFGLQPLIGKLAAIIGDARLGGKVDQTAIVERLLSISGEDELNINRKNLPHWVGQLISRLLILSNEIPKLTDASSALVGRFVILRLKQSFFGREDQGLFERLEPELPGILNLAIEGWHRLRGRGYFQQPASSDDVAEQFEDISSPIKQFVRERCELGAGHHVTRDALFDAWCNWCKTEGRDQPGIKAKFESDLSAAFSELQRKRTGSRGEQVYVYSGIKLIAFSPYDFAGLLQCIKAFQSQMAIAPGVFIWGIDFNQHPSPVIGLPAGAKPPPPPPWRAKEEPPPSMGETTQFRRVDCATGLGSTSVVNRNPLNFLP